MYVLTIFVLLTVLSKSQDLVWEDNLLRFIAQPQPLKETSKPLVFSQVRSVQLSLTVYGRGPFKI